MEINEEVVRRMDEENRRRLGNLENGQERINETLRSLGETLVRIDTYIKTQDNLPNRVASLEKTTDRMKGAAGVLVFLWGSVEALLHLFWKR